VFFQVLSEILSSKIESGGKTRQKFGKFSANFSGYVDFEKNQLQPLVRMENVLCIYIKFNYGYQGCQIVLDATYQNGKNIPNYHEQSFVAVSGYLVVTLRRQKKLPRTIPNVHKI
jgi:hypothetical protein